MSKAGLVKHFGIPGKNYHTRNATKNASRGRPSGGIAFIVDDDLEVEANMRRSDRIGTLQINKLIIIGVYLTYSDNTDANLDDFIAEVSILQNIVDECTSKKLDFIIIGDFNIDLARFDKHYEIFDDFLYDNKLITVDTQSIQPVKYTYRGHNGYSWIDHVVVSINNRNIEKCVIELNDGNMSDHLPILTNYNLTIDHNLYHAMKQNKLRKKIKYNWQDDRFLRSYGSRVELVVKEVESVLRRTKSESFTNEERQSLLDEAYKKLSHGICSSATKAKNEIENAPKQNSGKRDRSRKKKKSWWTNDIRTLHIKQCLAYKAYAQSGFKNQKLRSEYQQAKRLFRNQKNFNIKLKRDYVCRYLNELYKTDKNEFWRKLQNIERKQAQAVNIKIDTIRREYESIFTNGNCDEQETQHKNNIVNEFKNENVSKVFNTTTPPGIIYGMISELSCGKSVGLRGISHEMLKYCSAPSLHSLITDFYDLIINHQIQPTGFNTSILKPILKDYSKPNDEISNTRPVAISDALQNLFERVLLWRINDIHVDHDQQFGFKKSSSCSHAVFVVSQAANFAKQNGKRLYACAIDASKAFDKVSRPHLWVKLIGSGLATEYVLAIINYYEKSYMVAQIGDKFSEVFETKNGVRQGGVMSPKLFSIYVEKMINEIENVGFGIRIGRLHISAVMYADDLIILSNEKIGICRQITCIEQYGNENGLRFNPDKTELLIFNKNIKRNRTAVLHDEWQDEIFLNGKPVKEVKTMRYLGSYLSHDLSSGEHIRKKRTAANVSLTKINELGLGNTVIDIQTKAKMFKIFLRPVLMYGVENLQMKKSDAKQIKRADGNLLKRLLNVNKRCYTSEIKRSCNIELTHEKIKIIKLAFYKRIQQNEFTKRLYDELNRLNVKSSYPEEISKLLEPIKARHLNGSEFSTNEKTDVLYEALKDVGKFISTNNKTVQALIKIYKTPKAERIPSLIEFLTYNKSNYEFIGI